MDIALYGRRRTRDGEVGLAVFDVRLGEDLWELCAQIAMYMEMRAKLSGERGVRTSWEGKRKICPRCGDAL